MKTARTERGQRKLTGDALVRRHREHLQEFVKAHSEQAAQNLLAALPRRVYKNKLSAEKIAELIAEEFRFLYQ